MKTRSIAAAAVAILAVVAIVLTIIGYFGIHRRKGPVPTQTATASSAPIDVHGGSVQAFYDQGITWGKCAPGTFDSYRGVDSSDPSEYQCAFLKAPLDWDNPDGDQISLALAIHRSGKKDAPALFVNPGGPGGAVVSALPYYAGQGIGEVVVNAYDIVALDPRGVGDSTPVFCMTDAEKDKYNAGSETEGTDADSPQSAIAEVQEDSREFAQGCRDHSGAIFEHIDTVSAARDFDMVRSILGQDKLNLLGYSYGTFLGATYAGLYPAQVGRFVLDGALDPSLSVDEVSSMQMRGLDASLQQWITDCATQASCPMGRTKDEGIANVRSFLESLEASPLPTNDPDRPLTEGLAVTAMIGAMYNTQWWPELTNAYSDATRRNDGTAMLEIADLMNSRNPDGTYADNSTDAINAINNLDYKPAGTDAEWIARADALKSELSILDRYVGYPSAGLSAWPTEHAERAPIHATGAAPILVIGTTHDPATPYPMAEALASQLDSGVLITVEGWNHTAYRRGANQCVVRAVEDYLVKDTVPTDGLTCQ
nr:alpha/beta hydrolase [uncultured Actinomyces sp.]